MSRDSCHNEGSGFTIIVVLFILLIIIGAYYGGKGVGGSYC